MKLLKLCITAAAAALLAAGCGKQQPTEQPDPVAVKLAAPVPTVSDVTVNSATLTWQKIENALSYEIYLGDDPNPYKAIGTSRTLTGLQSDTRFTIRMKAVPESSSTAYLASDLSEEVSFKTAAREPLATPAPVASEVTTTSFSISWEEIENAASYEYIFNDGETVETESLTASFTDLSVGTEHSFKLRAIPTEEALVAHTESAWAQISVWTNGYTVLDSPAPETESVTCTGATFKWTAVENAESYTWKLGENGTETSTASLKASVSGLEAATEYSVYVCANPASDQQTYASSAWAELKFTTAAKTALSAPAPAQTAESSNSLSVSWSAVENAASYVYVFNGGDSVETALTAADFSGLTVGTQYSFKVKAVPSAEGAASYTESAWAEITVQTSNKTALGTPQASVTAKDAHSFSIAWAAVENAVDYSWKLGVGGEVSKTTELSLAFDKLDAATSYEVYVCANPAEGSETYVTGEWAKVEVTTDDATSHDGEDYEREDGEW